MAVAVIVTAGLAAPGAGHPGVRGSIALESLARQGSGTPVAFSIPVGSAPSAIAYDPSQGELFVANAGSNNVSVINDTLGTVVGNIPVGTGPSAILSLGGDVYVANELSGNVSVINGTTRQVTAS
jgi:YVTN family beta-propeller protein